MLRAIRTFGPEYLVDRQGSGVVTCDGYCSTCQLMLDDVMLEARVEELMAGPTARFIENQIVALQRAPDRSPSPAATAWPRTPSS